MPTPTRKVALTWGVIATLVLLVLVAGAWLYLTRGFTVKLRNVGDATLYTVVIRVTGREYPVGDLRPGATISAKVNPKGESGVGITFRDDKGVERGLDLGGYLEANYNGSLSADLTVNAVVKVDHSVGFP